jgi:hypothetical protein
MKEATPTAICGKFKVLNRPLKYSNPTAKNPTSMFVENSGYEVQYLPDEKPQNGEVKPECECKTPCELRLTQVISYDGLFAGMNPVVDGVASADFKAAQKIADAGVGLVLPPHYGGPDLKSQGDTAYSIQDVPNSSFGGYYFRNTWYVEVCAFCVHPSSGHVMKAFGCVRFNFSNHDREVEYQGTGLATPLPSESGFQVGPHSPTKHFVLGMSRYQQNPEKNHSGLTANR